MASLSFNYIVVPFFLSQPRGIHLRPIADRIKSKLVTQKGALLSIMGRVQLIKSVINGTLLYSFHMYSWPRALLKEVDCFIRNFIWSGDIHS